MVLMDKIGLVLGPQLVNGLLKMVQKLRHMKQDI